MEVGFAASVVTDAERPELEEVLRGVAAPAHWPGRVDRITVVQRLAGARSGAEVFAIDVEFTDGGRTERCVAKIDSAAAVTAEWTAVQTHLAGRRQVLLTPVEAVSEFVLDGSTSGLAQFGRAAIVYRHVADWAGEPARTPETLESIIGAALDRRDGGNTVPVLEGLIRRLGTALHQPTRVVSGPRTQSHLNPSLGEDLVLVVDHVDTGFPAVDAGQRKEISQLRRYRLDVLRAATRPPMRPEPDATISIDDLILLEVEYPQAREDGRFVGRVQETQIAIEPATHQARTALSAAADRKIPVMGRVRTTRAATHWQTFARFLPAAEYGPDRVSLGDVTLANPFTPLRAILTTDVEGRALATVHGDLNPRNVLVVGQQVFLIDFAQVKPDRPVVSDPAWLEMCLLRDVLAPRLGWPALVRLQRLLAAATRLGPAGDVGLSDEDDPVLRTAFELLWTIRRVAFDVHPSEARGRFATDYLEQLSFAAFRTVKWPDADHDALKIGATLAACGVAAEWLDEREPYRYWPRPELERLVVAARDRLRSGTGHAGLIVEALRTLDRHGEATEGVRHAVEAVRARLLATTYLPAARKIVAERPGDAPYIDVDAYVEELRTTGSAVDLVSRLPEAVVVGGAGGGKSTLADQLRLRLAKTLCTPDRDGPPARFPVLVRAGRITPGDEPERVLAQIADPPVGESHLRVGAVHLLIDEFDELTGDARQDTAGWIHELRRRYPRTHVVVCCRSLGFAPDLLGFPVAELQEVTGDMARRYANDVYLAKFGMAGRERADRLFELLSRPRYRMMAKLIRNPLFLDLLVHAYARPDAEDGTLPADVGALFGEWAGWLLRSAENGPDPHALDNALEKLAVAMVDRNASEAPYDLADPVMAALITTDLLHREGGQVRFRQQPLRDYYAARVLARADDTVLAERAGQFRWREPVLIMAGFEDNGAERTARLIEIAEGVDADFAAQVLRACREAPRNAIDRFVTSQLATLRAPDRGVRSWNAAARGLAELGFPPARSALLAVVEQPGLDEAARSAALAALVRPATRVKTASDDSNADLVGTVGRLLRAETPERLLHKAVEVVGEARLGTLGVAVADLIDAANPWDVVDAAYQTLRRIGTTVGERRERVYLSASEARLNATEEELRRTSRRRDIARLTDERLAHLERMAAAGRVDVLLPRRFSFGIADDPFWGRWLRGLPDEPELIRGYAEGDDRTAIAIAHRIVERHPELAGDLLAHTSPGSSPLRLLAAARVAASGAEHEDRLRSLIRELTETVDETRVEALTALVAALPRKSAVVESASVVRRVTELGRRDLLQGWPWFQLLTDLPFDEGLCAELLLSGEDDQATAAVFWLNADIAGGVLLDAGDPQSFRLPEAAHKALLARAPSTALPAFLGACVKAGAGTPELLRSACAAARQVDAEWPVQLMSSTEYGSVEQSALADLLARIGFLARHARITGDHEGAAAAHALLIDPGLGTEGVRTESLRTESGHPSVERGRLAGLAALGDWVPVLTGLRGADKLLHEIARNAVLHRPREPAADVGRWLDARLAVADLEPAVRETLASVREMVRRQER